MSCNQTTNDFVFPHIADSFLKTFRSPRPRVELWPIDLRGLAWKRMSASKENWTYVKHSIPANEIQTPSANGKPKQDEDSDGENSSIWQSSRKGTNEDKEQAEG